VAKSIQRILIAGVPAAAVVIVLAISAGPAGATLVCPPGVTNPAYCTNVLPIAVTNKATDVRYTQAWLNGRAGPGVNNGDITTYYFQYGKTKSYGKTTASGTVGSCPPGVTNRVYCTTPVSKSVSALVRGLSPNTVYHFRIVATNSDGTSYGADRSFKTKAIPPIKSVSVPNKVDVGKKFKIFVKMQAPATVTIKFNGKKYSKGYVRRSVTQKVKAPGATGTYTVTVKAVGDETETVTTTVKVVRPKRHHP
jgi:hypothetical protein